MKSIEPYVEELRQEAVTTRKLFERTPEGHHAWKPHPRSMSLFTLTSHIAEIPSWVELILSQDEFVMDPKSHKPWIAKDRGELLATFDVNITRAIELLAKVSDDRLSKPWTFKAAEKTIFVLPRVAVLRTMVLNHLIHHRGQLSVYLRLKDVPLPPIYGPTADEPGM
jgi:uncharacterized damage-inducible protein DinB